MRFQDTSGRRLTEWIMINQFANPLMAAHAAALNLADSPASFA
jgi:hypothetical protein